MKTKRLFAVDLGASGGKCFVGTFDACGFKMEEIHRFAHEAVSFHIADNNGEISERAFWDTTFIHQNIIKGLQAYRRDVAGSLDSIGIDTWGADGQLLSCDGECMGNMYAYRDHRLDRMTDIIKSRISEARIYGITGIHFQPFNMSNQLHWLVLNRKDLLKAGCFFLPAPSVFYYYLGGVRMVDSTWASVTQLMDARKKRWSTEVLRKLKIPAGMLPEIVEPAKIIGELMTPVAAAVGLNAAKLVSVGSHDTASAFAAAPVERPGDTLVISSGTWSLVGKLIPKPITSEAARAVNISNEGGIGNIRFLKNCMGTWIVQELRRIWRIADGREMDWDTITRLAEHSKPFGSLIDPDDESFYNPANMEKAIAGFCTVTGQPAPADRGACLRLVYESLALKYRMVNEQICLASGTRSTVVNIVGGGSKNRLLNQFAANATGLPVLAGPEEATAVGNLMVQALGLGIIRSMAETMPIIKKTFPIRQFKPKDGEAWDRAYSRFKGIVRKS
ncbi:MAG: rhamnulokinase [Verrucomicrobia bacterium]|nr:rhamnulokinase [Verrucomicrobiota bacterium]